MSNEEVQRRWEEALAAMVAGFEANETRLLDALSADITPAEVAAAQAARNANTQHSAIVAAAGLICMCLEELAEDRKALMRAKAMKRRA